MLIISSHGVTPFAISSNNQNVWCCDLPEAKTNRRVQNAVWVWFKLFISSYEKCNTINAPSTGFSGINFRIHRITQDDPERPENIDNCMSSYQPIRDTCITLRFLTRSPRIPFWTIFHFHKINLANYWTIIWHKSRPLTKQVHELRGKSWSWFGLG